MQCWERLLNGRTLFQHDVRASSLRRCMQILTTKKCLTSQPTQYLLTRNLNLFYALTWSDTTCSSLLGIQDPWWVDILRICHDCGWYVLICQDWSWRFVLNFHNWSWYVLSHHCHQFTVKYFDCIILLYSQVYPQFNATATRYETFSFCQA